MFPVTSAFELPGMRVERSLGITFGLVVRSMGFSKAVTGGISSLRQGEVSQFTVVLEDARRHAIDRMIENARLLGANAVIAMRFDSSEIGKARAEVVAYGTAVVAAQLQTARSLPRCAQATAPCRDESGDRASANRSPESFINGLVFTLKGLTLGW
jgi:uncharacterized protein YbjQ (UPF0145 family)